MKKLNFLFFICFLTISTVLTGQEDIGYAHYKITDVSSDNPQMEAQLGMLKNGSMTIHESDDKSLVINNTAGMSITKVLTDKSTEEALMYMSAMGQKYKVKMSKDDVDEEDVPTPEFKVDQSVTKSILDYNCHKVTMTTETAQGTLNTTLFVTKDLVSSGYSKSSMMQNQDLEFEGFPMEMTVEIPGQFSMTYTLDEVKMRSDVDESAFEIDETGYEEKTQEELQGMFGGGM